LAGKSPTAEGWYWLTPDNPNTARWVSVVDYGKGLCIEDGQQLTPVERFDGFKWQGPVFPE
jgi:hypothetical protein